MNSTLRQTLLALSVIGGMFAGACAASSPSASLPAILFMLAGVGFSLVFIYYLIVHGEVENNK